MNNISLQNNIHFIPALTVVVKAVWSKIVAGHDFLKLVITR
ncbi:MAG: hypothetical protein AAB706_03225 [Patescibacteria group bacterium]